MAPGESASHIRKSCFGFDEDGPMLGPNSVAFSQEVLQSTSNIVKIPTIVHEEINAIYAEPMQFTTGFMPLRDFLRGTSFEQQRAWGLWTLQQVGAIN